MTSRCFGWLRCVLALACALCAAGASPQENVDAILHKADRQKITAYGEFIKTLDTLAQRAATLSPPQLEYLQYLESWRDAYEGRYQAAMSALKPIVEGRADATLRFRSLATIVNVLALTRQYEDAFAQSRRLLNLLPEVADKGAREQGLSVAAFLYNRVGEYELGQRYAETIIEENWEGRGACTGGQLSMQARRYKNNRSSPATSDQHFQNVINACVQLGELLRAAITRMYYGQWLTNQNRFEDVIRELAPHYDATKNLKSPRITSEYDALLAVAHRQTGNSELAKQFAQRAVDGAVRSEFTEPLVNAYRLLYLLAKEQGDNRSALGYHEKFAAADKGYLDDLSAQQLAYQRVRQEVDANKLQIEALNKQNEVLKLKNELGDKAVENTRLYIALLAMVLVFIVLWAFWTKRSQLHFMKLSRRDGLTGIINRPHFIALAEQALESCRKSQQEACMVLCDLDHFKAINDKFGHAEGDLVLRHAVAACQTHMRTSDIFARVGGEEFGILLRDCGLETARSRAEDLRRAIAAIDKSTVRHNVSASFGIACTTASGFELRQLLAHADMALYQAKYAGRNRVVIYDAVQGETHGMQPAYGDGGV
jgi:diguanylate cyclase (GGDEF)-like protein